MRKVFCIGSQVSSGVGECKKFFVRVLSPSSQHGGKANRTWFQSMVLAMGGVAIE